MLTQKVLNAEETKKMYPWIKANFPDDERRPLLMILQMMRKGIYEVIGFYNDEGPVGYALSILPGNNPSVLLDYLVVNEKLRGQGIGADILQMLRRYYTDHADAILIESENPEEAPDPQMAARRVGFYCRSGAVQMPFRVSLWGVDYAIFVLPTGETLPAHEWSDVILDVYRQTLPPMFYHSKVRLIRGETEK